MVCTVVARLRSLVRWSLSLWLGVGLTAQAPAQEGQCTWVHGELATAAAQVEYMQLVRKMYDYYQQHTAQKGPLVAERDLGKKPAGDVVFLGTVDAFTHLDWLDVPIGRAADGTVTVGGQPLTRPRTGIFLQSRDGTRIGYLGLSAAGLRDIFTVPTGQDACTITRANGKVSHRGRYDGDQLVLSREHFLPQYPSAAELLQWQPPPGLIEAEPVWTGERALTAAFRDWLGQLVAGQQVLFVGENHWNQEVDLIFHQVAQELLERGLLRAVFLELNYSFSPWYDHYVGEADDERAKAFLRDHLHPMVGSVQAMAQLEALRRWNAGHSPRVHVACIDMEWKHDQVVRRIVQPFLRRVDAEFELPDPYAVVRAHKEQPRQQVAALLAKARAEHIVGELPFVTADYIERVLTNLWDTAAIADFNQDRQRHIVRNITEFHGALLGDGLALFKGGGFHALKHRPDGESFYRDAAYLNEVFPATKGKVVTLRLCSLGYDFADLAGVDAGAMISSATAYNQFVRDFQQALQAGEAAAGAHYLLDGGLGAMELALAALGQQLGSDLLWLRRVDRAQLAARYGGEAAKADETLQHDGVVYVLRGKLARMRPSKLPE